MNSKLDEAAPPAADWSGDVLRRARVSLGWSQRELAKRAGVHQPQVVRAERGEDMQISVLARIAAPLDLSPGLVPLPRRSTAGAIPAAVRDVPLDHVAKSFDSWRTTWPEVDPEVFSVIARLSLAGRHVEASIEHIAGLRGLIGGDVVVLGALRRSGAPYASTPTALKRLLWISLPGLKKRLDRLASLGFITRSGNPNDRRGFVVGLTEKGRAVIDDMVAHSPERLWQTLRQMPGAELAELSSALRSLLVKLEVDEEGAGKH